MRLFIQLGCFKMAECTLRLLASMLNMAPNILDPNIFNIIVS